MALVDPGFFTHFFSRVDPQGDGVISLVGLDGIAIARHVGASSTFGNDMRSSTLFANLARRPIGSFTSRGVLENVPRLISYRTMRRYPLVVMVGSSLEGTLAPMRERTRLYYLVAAAMSAVIVLVAFGVLRSLARQRRDFDALTDAQARLRASVARSEAITENMAAGVVTTDFEGRIESVNSAACRMFGYQADEMAGKHVSRLVDESERGHLATVIRGLQAGAERLEADDREFLSVRKDGTVFEVEVLLSRLVIDGARHVIGIVHDISGRKVLERAMRRSEALFRATFDQAMVGIVHTGLDGRFMRVNRAACEMLGYTERELLALGYREVTHPEELPISVARHKALLADPKQPFEYHTVRRFLRKDGSMLWALTSVCVIRHDDGNPDFFLTMVQDITELKRVEQMKDEFVSTVSHELRTPLTSIRGSLGLLAGDVAGPLPETARSLVLIAERGCERLIRLVNEILDTERIESGRMQFDVHAAELRPLIERAMESMEGFAQAHRVTLRMEAPDEPIVAGVDADRFIQVMTNLISNAVKFSPPGAPVEIALARTADGGARIEVRDRGPGIPTEFQPRIFLRFSQADASSAGQKGGTGLGLNIAKAIVDHLGGTIGFRPNAGAGTVFFVQLPAPPKNAAAMRDLAQPQEA